MRSKTVDRLLKSTPEDVKIFVDLYADLVVRINQILREKGLTQKALAERLDKSPSEIHKWLSGGHNFTLRSLAKLEAELGETLLTVPKPHKHTDFISPQGRTTFKVYVDRNRQEAKPEWKYEVILEQNCELANVG
ncbi:helix-turn-helix domain-containing protein [Runella slithyformis]|uniref:Helix-turn-helix domain protein n=1 Tax=Runella slithyformis (strain ATCC 29530 / DSM 19594 / LMG 11500 / NCIMB 11436 / LSU 4) TaxID=761193 RepID=A0A7U4E707_RUNSL|nr:helix-turn-helix transcriptional regulator [Runella slithyformis]AEI49869.1 helix-turn-helix domain protein [Runella slithyformis DSM 19594]